MSTGGGASGEVILPEYLIFQQANWLNNVKPLAATAYTSDSIWAADYAVVDFNVRDEMTTSADNNPHTGVAAYDPESDLGDMDDRGDEYMDAADDIDPEQLLADSFEAALEQIDGVVINESLIDDSVAAFTETTDNEFLRGMGRAMMGFQGGRAVMTTHYDARLGDFETDRRREVQKYEADLRMNMHLQRIEMSKHLAGQFVQVVQLQLNALQNAAALQIDLGKIRIAAKQDQINIDLNFDVNEENWRLDRFDYGAKMIAAYSGGGPAPKPLSTGERVMQTISTAATLGIAGGQALKSEAGGGLIGAGVLIAGILTGGLK
jgi:hypothetical protein